MHGETAKHKAIAVLARSAQREVEVEVGPACWKRTSTSLAGDSTASSFAAGKAGQGRVHHTQGGVRIVGTPAQHLASQAVECTCSKPGGAHLLKGFPLMGCQFLYFHSWQ